MKTKKYLAMGAIGLVSACSFLGSQSTFARVAVDTAFTDERFYKCVVETYNNLTGSNKDYTNEADKLTAAELESIETLDCSKDRYTDDAQKIANVDGLEKLKNLDVLNLQWNALTKISLPANTKITNLNVSSNRINEINLKNAKELAYLDAGDNELTTIDLSENKKLVSLDLTNNLITQIDITGLSRLATISLDGKTGILDKNLIPEKDGDNYVLDLGSLLFMANNSNTIKWPVDCEYDSNTHKVTISDLSKVTRIAIYPSDSVQKNGQIIVNSVNGGSDSDDKQQDDSDSDKKGDSEDSKKGGDKADIKVPDTGMFSGENGGSLMIMISLGALGAVSGVAYIMSYITKRYHNNRKFRK